MTYQKKVQMNPLTYSKVSVGKLNVLFAVKERYGQWMLLKGKQEHREEEKYGVSKQRTKRNRSIYRLLNRALIIIKLR